MAHPTRTHQPVPSSAALGERPSRARWLALVLLAAAQFMLILDVTVLNVALPQLGAELGLERALSGWAITAYVIPFGGLLLFGGRLADLFGSRRMFLIGLTLFTTASFFAGFADNASSLFATRAVQGVGAALLSPAALATVTSRFTGADRHRALAAWGAVGAVGAAVGVLIGGILTDGPGWRWIFFINVPVGVVVAVLLPFVVRAVPVLRRGRGLDILGAFLVTSASGSLIYGITSIGDGARPARAMTWLAVAALLFLFFVVRERTARDPLLNVGILTRRPVQAGVLVMLAASALLVGSFFLFSFVLQSHHGWSPLATGFAFFPIAVATLFGAHLSGHIISENGGRRVAAVAFILATLGTGLAAFGLDTIPLLIAGVSIAALGLGGAFVSATTTAMSHVEPYETGITSGIINTFHELGAAVGVAALSVIAAGSLAAPQQTSGFVTGYWTIAVVALVAAVVAVAIVPAGKPAAGTPRFVH